MKEKLVKEWLEKAERDLGLADLAIREKTYPDLICFHLPQAVEKYLKAVIQKHTEKVPRLHSLSYLLEVLERHVEIPEEIRRMIVPMEDYSVGVRYPGLPEPTWEDVDRSFTATKKIKEFIYSILEESR